MLTINWMKLLYVDRARILLATLVFTELVKEYNQSIVNKLQKFNNILTIPSYYILKLGGPYVK